MVLLRWKKERERERERERVPHRTLPVPSIASLSLYFIAAMATVLLCAVLAVWLGGARCNAVLPHGNQIVGTVAHVFFARSSHTQKYTYKHDCSLHNKQPSLAPKHFTKYDAYLSAHAFVGDCRFRTRLR